MLSRTAIRSLPVAVLMMFFAITITTDAFAPPQSAPKGYRIQDKQTQHASRISPLFANPKSGGKIMKDAEMYRKTVLEDTSMRPTLVFFTAPWCGPCRLTTPCVKEVKQQFSNDIEVVEVCTDDFSEIAEGAGVVSIPTIQFYHQGKKMDTIVGCVAKSVLANSVSKILEDVANLAESSS
ncbi:MAG: hypothetical protein SGBAC_003117 [Bacillariaceae sp.]